MHPRIREIMDYLEGQRLALRRAIEAVPPTLHGQRPAPDSWSVAEVVEHLGLVERRVGEMFATALAKARENGLAQEQDASPVLTTMDLVVVADRTRRIVANQSGLPRGGLDVDAAWQRLDEVRRATLAALRNADGLALGDVAVPHRMLGTLNLYQWMLFLGAHEERHAAQIRAIHSALTETPSPRGS